MEVCRISGKECRNSRISGKECTNSKPATLMKSYEPSGL